MTADGLDITGGAAEDGDDALPAEAGWDAGADPEGSSAARRDGQAGG